jgi:hypothetical protein
MAVTAFLGVAARSRRCRPGREAFAPFADPHEQRGLGHHGRASGHRTRARGRYPTGSASAPGNDGGAARLHPPDVAPSNAIAYGSRRIPLTTMPRHDLLLDAAGIAVIVLALFGPALLSVQAP